MAAALLCTSAAQAAPAAGAGIEVTGNHLTTLGGTTVRLLGVNRSSGEYNCISQTTTTVFAGPTNAASIAAMTSWHVNVVRLPLNEDCWLGINGVNPRLGGAQYRLRVKRYVDSLNAAGLYVILDLHWAAPGKILPNEQWPMADATHAPAFWRSVGSMFAADRAVLFDLYNEPFVSTWSCWENGCSTQFKDIAGQNVTYLTAGMQPVSYTHLDVYKRQIWFIPVLPVALFVCAGVIFAPEPTDSADGSRPLGARRRFGALLRKRGVRATLQVSGAVACLAIIVAIAVPMAATEAVRESQSLVASGNLPGALERADEAVQLQPYAAAGWLQEALVQEQAHNLGAALKDAEQAKDRQPVNWSNWLVLSRLEARTGHASAALADYDHARLLNPHNPLFS